MIEESISGQQDVEILLIEPPSQEEVTTIVVEEAVTPA